MLFWYAFRPQLLKFALACMGTFGATSLFAFTTGALMFRLGWFGLGIAGVLGMLVAHRLAEGEKGHGLGMGMANLRLQIRAMEQQRQQQKPADAGQDGAAKDDGQEARSRADRLELVSLGSLAMTVIGFIMFFRYQV
ncbi:MAG: hypothetical protein MI725_14290 [Pirellulales bacterium]|nr:hypothetical protein [Pirellulales bacterium]